MKSLSLGAGVAAITFFSSGTAEAKGCIRGAIVGGAAGHMAGHGRFLSTSARVSVKLPASVGTVLPAWLAPPAGDARHRNNRTRPWTS
jgi:hypothetical protein